MTQIDPELHKEFRKLPRFSHGPRSAAVMRYMMERPAIAGLLLPKASTDGVAIEEIPTPGSEKTMRVYRRADSAAPVPVVFWIHGGGYIVGSNKMADHWGVGLTGRLDCAAVFPGYRLAPKHPFPAALDDLKAAIDWILRDGPQRGLDPSRIVIGGESAGGGLAAALTQRLYDEGIPIKGQALVYPMLDDRTAVRTDIGKNDHHAWTNGSNHYGWSSYLNAEPGGDTTSRTRSRPVAKTWPACRQRGLALATWTSSTTRTLNTPVVWRRRASTPRLR